MDRGSRFALEIPECEWTKKWTLPRVGTPEAHE